MAQPTQAEIDAAYAQYQQQQQQAAPQASAGPSQDEIDQAYAAYQAQQGQQTQAPAPPPNMAEKVANSGIGSTIMRGIQNARSMPYGALNGLNALGEGAFNIGKDFANTITQNALPPSMQTHFQEQAPYDFSARAPSKEGAMAGEIGSAFLMPGVGGARLVNAASKIPKIGAEVAPYLPTALTGAAYGGLYGAANPNTDLLRSMALSMAIPIGLQGAGRGLGAGIGAAMARPLNKTQKTAEEEQALGVPNASLTPAQAGVNLQDAQEQGMKPTLGQISNAQNLNRTYEHASYLPGASQRQPAGQFVGQVQKFANDIYHNLFGNTPERQVNPTIVQNVNKLLTDKEIKTAANYNNVDNLADKAGIIANRENPQKYAQNQLNNYNYLNKANMQNPLKGETKVLELLETASKPIGKKYNAITMQDEPYEYKFSDLRRERSAVGEELARIRAENPKATTAQRVLENLYKQYSSSMESVLKNSGDQEIYGIWKKANDFHRDEVEPFYKGNLPFILKNGQHEDIVNTLLNDSQHASVVKMLPPETRKLLLGSKLMEKSSEIKETQGPNGEIIKESSITPVRIGTTYKNMGKSANLDNVLDGLTHTINGKEVPLPIALNKLNTLHSMSNAIRKIAQEVPTGYVTKAMAGKAALPIIGALTGYFSGDHSATGIAEGLGAGLLGAKGIGKAITKYHTSPKVLKAYVDAQNRQKIIQSMIPQMPGINPAGIAALLNQGGQ